MNPLAFLKRKPRYELSSQDYFSNYLTQTDSQFLQQFIRQFTGQLKTNIGLLAVGSSTFPQFHWEGRRELNKSDSTLEASESYRDIDLLVVPIQVTPLDTLKEDITTALTELGYESKQHQSTLMGVRYVEASFGSDDGSWRKGISPFMDIGYGIHSISTTLSNDRSLDLILGREDLKNVTFAEQVKQERKHNSAFSIVHGSEYLN